MTKKVKIKWLRGPEPQDYPAALSYLSLLYDKRRAAAAVGRLKRASIAEFKAKDISGHPACRCLGSAITPSTGIDGR